MKLQYDNYTFDKIQKSIEHIGNHLPCYYWGSYKCKAFWKGLLGEDATEEYLLRHHNREKEYSKNNLP